MQNRNLCARKAPLHMMDCHKTTQESGAENCHPYTCRMAKYSGKNVSRDFWRFASVPVVTRSCFVNCCHCSFLGQWQVWCSQFVGHALVRRLFCSTGHLLGASAFEESWGFLWSPKGRSCSCGSHFLGCLLVGRHRNPSERR